jgi:hypothetical protein
MATSLVQNPVDAFQHTCQWVFGEQARAKAENRQLWGLLWGPHIHLGESRHISNQLAPTTEPVEPRRVAGLSAFPSTREMVSGTISNDLDRVKRGLDLVFVCEQTPPPSAQTRLSFGGCSSITVALLCVSNLLARPMSPQSLGQFQRVTGVLKHQVKISFRSSPRVRSKLASIAGGQDGNPGLRRPRCECHIT